jgi:hypothetical protein
MAVEIREMVIQAKVGDDKSEKSTESTPKKSSSASDKVVSKLSYSIKKQIIEDCVNEVMEKLNKSRNL